MQALISTLNKRVVSLEEEIRLLKNGKNSKTSSTSPSHDIGRSNTKNSRVVSGNKVGGQKGHEGTTLLMTDTPDEVIEYKDIDFCQACNKDRKSVV